MKNILFLAIAFFAIQEVVSQDVIKTSNDKIYDTAIIDVKPEFIGGISEFYKYVGNNYKIPDVKGLSGKVYVTFIIEKDGSLSDIKILRDIGHDTGKEALRVLSVCPKWKPGEQNGKPVRVLYSLPIAIKTDK
jgi:protein TonB